MKINPAKKSSPTKKIFSGLTATISQHPIFVVTTLFVFGAVMIFWHIYALQERLVNSAALRNASLYSQALAEFRSLYTSEVVNIVKKQGILVTHDYKSKAGAIPLPVTFSMKLGEAIGAHQSGAETRLYSAFPFPWRRQKTPLPDAFARAAWQALSRNPQKPFYRFENYHGRPSIRYATADVMRSSCVRCHNNHPQTPKRNWRVGEVRGVLEIIHPLDGLAVDTRAGLRGTFALLALLTASGVGALMLITKKLRARTSEATQNARQTEVMNLSLNEEILQRKKVAEELRQARKNLDAQVVERTIELTVTNDKLQQQLEWREQAQEEIDEVLQDLEWKNWELGVRGEELERARQKAQKNQEQLVQSEKMASLGQLAAGVAHEINNPVGFVMSNLGTLGEYVAVFKEIIDLYEQALSSAPDLDKLKILYGKISELRKKEDLSYILADIDQLLAESKEGTERVRDIVQSLKSFARLDEAQLKEADLNEGIEATLKIVWNELKYRCQVHQRLNPLPMIRCYPGQLNQVFMNLLVNAAQAIPERGEITIETTAEAEEICIRVTDTGVGISPENIAKLFDPFYTTKEVGEGTGLGLAISHGIIVKHHGSITVKSEVGVGTTFTIRLPVSGIQNDG